MSDTKDQVIETLETIKSDLNAGLETKASVEAVETSVETAKTYTDEAISAKAVETTDTIKAQGEQIEALEAKLASMPAVDTTKTQESNMFFKQDELDTRKFSFIQEVEAKAYNDNTDVSGGRVESVGIVGALEQANIFRTYAQVLQTGSGAFKLPTLTVGTFAAEATVNTSRTQGGSVANVDVVINNWVSSNQISKPAVEDINGFDAMMTRLMVQAAGKTEAQDAVAVLKAATITSVKTGAAAALPAASAIIGKLADVAAEISSSYIGQSKWYMSREALAVVRASNNTGLNFNAATGLFSIFGYDVVIVDYMASGGTGGDEAVYFGDMSMGLIIGSRKTLEIGRYMETAPGFVTYFGDIRSKAAVWVPGALVSLTTAA